MTTAVSVTGIGCRFPGGIRSADALLQFLIDGKSAIGPAPARLQTEIPNARGGYIEDLEYFDHEFFGVSKSEALCMDPQQRVLAECVHEALLDAGIDPDTLEGTNTGVFVGAMDKGWSSIVDETSAFAAIGSHPALIANRVSFFYDLKGPSMTCDVSCSGSLAAIYYAVMSLQTGDCDLAIAAGVNILLLERFATMMTAGGFLSKDFQCFTFDERANGYVQSEGCGVVVLKRSTDVTADERVYGEILGQSFNEDGRTGCISTPSGSSQSKNIRRAMARAGVKTSDLDFIQAHGTGTGVGDPIEIAAILEGLADGHAAEQPAILMHSIKQNLGHMELAAGIGNLIATLAILRQGICPPNILLRRINPVLQTMLGAAVTRFELPTKSTPLRAKRGTRFGLLGAFGYGGTNVHMVVRAEPGEFPTSKPRPTWKRQSRLAWVCPAFIRKDDPALAEGHALAATRAPSSAAHDEPVIDGLVKMLRELVNQDIELSCTLKDLGLDSLSTIELARLAHQRFGVVLDDLAEVSHSSVAKLAETIAAKRSSVHPRSELATTKSRGTSTPVVLSAEQLQVLGERANLRLPPGATHTDLLNILEGLGALATPRESSAPASAREKVTLDGYLLTPSVREREEGTAIHYLISEETFPVIARTNHMFYVGFYIEMLKAALAGRIDSSSWYIKYVHLYHMLRVPPGEARNVRLEHWLDAGDDYAWVTSESLSRGARDGGIFAEPEEATARIHACVRTCLPGAQTSEALRQRLSPPDEGLPPYADPAQLVEHFGYHISGETILALMERFQKYKGSVDVKEAWFSTERVLFRLGAAEDRWHMALPARVWDASVLACEVPYLAQGHFPIRVVDSLEDVAIDESGEPCSEYWIYAVADHDERPRYPAGEKANPSMAGKSWANVWVIRPDGRIVARLRQRMVQIHDVNLRDAKLWTEAGASALLVRLWQLEEPQRQQVVRSLLLSTLAFSCQVDVMSFDRQARLDQRITSALQHRILFALGVPIIARTQSTFDTFAESVDWALAQARPGDAELAALADAIPVNVPATSHRREASAATQLWVKGEDVPGSIVRLFCLPYGSGSAESYAAWQAQLEPSGIEVRPIQMPGRAERSEEIPIEQADVFFSLFEEAIRPLILDGKPYALYGQSMGGALVYGWLRYAEERGLPLPAHVFVAGFPAFHLAGHWHHANLTPLQLNAIAGTDSPLYSEMTGLCVQALAEMFSLTGWLRRSLLSHCVDPADVAPLLPRILGDHGLARECAERYAAFRPLPQGVGLTALHAEHDDRVTREEAHAWTRVGTQEGQVRFCFLPGQDHFFCDSTAGQSLAFEEIRSVLGRRGSSDRAVAGRALVLFPGQGSQKQKGFIDGLEDASEWRSAADALGYDLLRLCKDSPEELASTRVCQAAIYVASYVRWKRWAESNAAAAENAIFAGFSLGEITALVAGGVFTFAEGLSLIRARGEAMERACRSVPSTMITCIGLSRDAVVRLVDHLNRNRSQEVSWLCNELWDEGFVVGVRREDASTLVELARSAGAQKTIELEVDGAFHTPLMREAQSVFESAMIRVMELRTNGEPTLRAPVYSNVTGHPYATIDDVFDLLPKQICSPVRWAHILTHVKGRSEPITRVVLPSPAEQLAGMLKVQSPVLHSKHSLI